MFVAACKTLGSSAWAWQSMTTILRQDRVNSIGAMRWKGPGNHPRRLHGQSISRTRDKQCSPRLRCTGSCDAWFVKRPNMIQDPFSGSGQQPPRAFQHNRATENRYRRLRTHPRGRSWRVCRRLPHGMCFCEIARQVKRLSARGASKLKLLTLDIFQIVVIAQSSNSDFAMAVWAGKLEGVGVRHDDPDRAGTVVPRNAHCKFLYQTI